MEAVQSLSQKSEIFASSLYTREPLVRRKSVRISFFCGKQHTINKAVDTMRLSGINAVSKKMETEEYIEYTVKIPKKEATEKPHKGKQWRWKVKNLQKKNPT